MRKFTDVWKYIINSIRNSDISEDGIVRDYHFYASSNAMYNNVNNVSYLFTLDKFGREIPVDYRDEVRARTEGNTRVSFISHFEKTSINWESPRLQAMLKSWEKTVDNDGTIVNSYNYHSNTDKLEIRSRREESLIYLKNVSDSQQLAIIRTMMVISGERGDMFDRSVENIMEYLKKHGILAARVSSEIEGFLDYYSPFKANHDSAIEKEVGNMAYPEEILSRFTSYSQGTVGNGPYAFGRSQISGYPMLHRVKPNPSAPENYLIVGETGSGKSYFVKYLTLQFLADSRVNVTIMDVEGNEYAPMAQYTANGDKVVNINLSQGSGNYFDPMEIVQYDAGDEEISPYNISLMCAKALFRIIAGQFERGGDWVDTIIDEAVAEAYARRGVSGTEPSTWHKSQGMSLKDVYEVILEYDEESRNLRTVKSRLGELSRDDSDSKYALGLLTIRLDKYFSPNGSKASSMLHRISVDDVVSAKLVVCSFGLKLANENQDPIELALNQTYAGFISYLRSVYSKRDGKFNCKVFEEIQRWAHVEGSQSIINTAVTGGRKLGDIVLMLSNKPSELLDGTGIKVFENVTSFVIGAVNDSEVRSQLSERLSVPHLLPVLDDISTPITSSTTFESNDLDEDRISAKKKELEYKHEFLAVLNRHNIDRVRVEIDPEISSSEIFATGVEVHAAAQEISFDEDW